MTINLEKIKQVMLSTMAALTMCWIVFALSFQVYFIFLELTNNEDEMRRISNELTIRIDGRYVDNPKNIFYSGK